MKIENSGIIFITLCSRCGVDQMGSSEDWARSLGEEIEISKRVDREMAQTVAMNRAIEAEKMPLKWEEVLAAFQEHCIAYNEQIKPERKLGLHRTGSYEFAIKPDALPEIITGKYDPGTRWIEIRSSIGKETFYPTVIHSGSGDVELMSYQAKTVKSATLIAQDTLRRCLTER